VEEFIAFASRNWLLVTAFLVVLGLLIGSEVRRGKRGFKGISPMQATTLSNHDNALFLDVREVAEYRQGHLLEVLHIPLGQLSSQLQKLEAYKDRPIIAYCRSGARSAQACEILVKAGFQSVYNLNGGIMEWQSQGLPIQKD
jgi:rhodanese-related sulfurtransferase